MSGAETFRVAAETYDRHVGRYAPGLGSALIEFAGVEPGMRALDVGCGPGALTAQLARRLGATNVCGAEPSEPFAEACRERVGVEVVSAPAEALPFEDGAFDAALSQLVVNFMSDAEGQAELRDAYRRRLGVGGGPFELSARAWAAVGTVS